MADRRELILARLEAILAGIDGIKTAVRNIVEFDDTQLPAAAVLEGDEEVNDSDAGRGRPSLRPSIVTATPQVYLRAGDDAPGTTLNTLRLAIINAVLSDSELNALSLNGRGVRYAGMQSTLHVARTMIAAHALVFAIAYTLNPSEA